MIVNDLINKIANSLIAYKENMKSTDQSLLNKK